MFCLDRGTHEHEYRPLPCRDGIPPYTLFPFWADLRIIQGKPHGIFHETLGEAPRRSLTIEWYLTRFKHEGHYHFKIHFQEERPNVVSFAYYNVPDQGSECTVGIQGPMSEFKVSAFCPSIFFDAVRIQR
jgi:hypothetical protein